MKEAGYYATNNSKTDYNIGDVERFITETWNESSDKPGWWNRGHALAKLKKTNMEPISD